MENTIYNLSDAQRHALIEISQNKNNPISTQNVLCERSNLNFLTFKIPHGIDTIKKIFLSKTNVLTNFCISNNVSFTIELLYGSRIFAREDRLLASFHLRSFSHQIELLGEAFPIFMFPMWQFSINVIPSENLPMQIVQDLDLVISSIFMEKSFSVSKFNNLQKLHNNPEKYTFRTAIKKKESSVPPFINVPSDIHRMGADEPNNPVLPIAVINNPSNLQDLLSRITGGNNEAIITIDVGSDSDFDSGPPGMLFNKIFGSDNFLGKSKENNENKEKNKEPSIANATNEVLPYKKLDYNLKNISDLLQIINDVPLEDTEKYNFAINIKKLHKIKAPLEKLNAMVGLTKIKEEIIDWILYFISNLPKNDNTRFMNIAMYGAPGVGKTHISEILAEILANIGAIKNNKVTKVLAQDLISNVVGGSEKLTKTFLNANKGCVILLDEAYSIARSSNSQEVCAFGVKIIDIINQFLSENTDTIMIVCGYKDLLEKYFFNVNKGLSRRFPWNFTLDAYTPEELYQIMMQKINDFGYTISVDESQHAKIVAKIKNNKDSLTSNVGDIINIISKTLSMHARNILSLEPESITTLHGANLVTACNNYIDGVQNNNSAPPEGMYF